MAFLSWYRYWFIELLFLVPAIFFASNLLIPPTVTLPEPEIDLVQVELADNCKEKLLIKPLEEAAPKKKKVKLEAMFKPVPSFTKTYQGKIGKFPVTMLVTNSNGDITGNYSYDRVRKPLKLKGSVQRDAIYSWYGDNCCLTESNRFGEESGEFNGVMTDYEFFGYWSNGKRNLPFKLTALDSRDEGSAQLERDVDDRYRCDDYGGLVYFPEVKLKNKKVEKLVKQKLKFENVFDPDMKGWLCSAPYFVTYNKGNLVNLVWWAEGNGAYPSQWYQIATVNLKTGKSVKVEDILLESKLEDLAKLVDSQMQYRIGIQLDENVEPHDHNWVKEELDKHHFTVKNLKSFSVNGDGITFLYDFGFPQVSKAYEPQSEYFFSWEELSAYIKPDGLLKQYLDLHL